MRKKFIKTLTISYEIRIINQTVQKLSIFLSTNCVNFLNCIDVENDNLYTVYIQLFFGGIHYFKKLGFDRYDRM